jgi:transcriptional regulator with XRE-family HTH domain
VTAVDRIVGARIRERRTTLGMTQQQLAQLVGVTYQQLHKYEQAINRISAGRLFRCAVALNASVDFFFQDLESPTLPQGHRRSLSLSRAFNQITELHLQHAVAEVARWLAEPAARGSQQDVPDRER